MKKLMFVLFLGWLCGMHVALAGEKQPLDRIVAIVNDSVITSNELTIQVNVVRRSLEARQMAMPPDNILRKQVLEHMINSDLEEQMAKSAGIEVDSHDIDDAINKIAERNHITLAEMHQMAEGQGFTWKAYRQNLKKEIMISELQQKVVGRIVITDQQVDSYLAGAGTASTSKAFHLEDILIPLSGSPTSQEVATAEKRAESVMDKLKQGANFNQLAVAESGGEDALQGGDLGFRQLPELPEAFAKRVVTMHPGDLSGPIRTANGWHIIKLVAIEGGASTAGPTKEQVRNLLYQRKYNEAVDNWLMQLRHSVYIKIFL